MAKKVTVIDFFCGAGGFSEGFRMSGFDIIMGIDNWQPAITTHNANHGLHDSVKNILDFENIDEILKLPDSDIIVGSPPCVLFSLSNHGGNANKDLGVRLIKAFYRVIAVKKHQKNSTLKAWLMENVPNSRNYVAPFYTFRDLDLTDWANSEGIDPNSKAIAVKENGDVLSSNEYGSGQTRKRFVCGEITQTGKFPRPEKTSTTGVTIDELFSNFPKPMGVNHNPSPIVQDPNYPDISLRTKDLHDQFYDSGVYEVEWHKALDAKRHHPYMGMMSFPENKQKPSRTIMATKSASTREAILYKSELNRTGDGEYRTPTIREAATIMGFPITYEFYGNESTKWRQVGNAVCVQLSYALANKVKQLLSITLPKPKTVKRDLSSITFLDSPEQKVFDKPPKRNSSASFRAHPMKTGNLTIDLTNRARKDSTDWNVVAYTGTGRGYAATVITKKHQKAARTIAASTVPGFIKLVDDDPIIRPYTRTDLDKHNTTYGSVSADESHPYNLVKRIADYVNKCVSDDIVIDVTDGALADIKSTMPISQVLSIYAMGTLL